jgi:MFS transporter, DHA1 family, multidrug resistance protein
MLKKFLSFKEPPLFILLLLVSFASVSSVLFTPALPLIGEQFGITDSTAQLTMTFFLIGYAVGNLLYAPFANRFGRKPALYLGIFLAICGSILILGSAASGFPLFVIGRLVQALGSGVGMNIVYTMIGDLYQVDTARKKFSSLGFSFAIGPSLAIVLGGFLTKSFGWESCFYFLVGYSFLLLFLSFFLPETLLQRDHEALRWKKVVANYGKKFRNGKVIICAITIGTVTSMIYVFVSAAPFIGIKTVGLSPQSFGLWSFIPALGLIAGSMISHQLAGKTNIFTIFKLGIITILIAASAMLVLFNMGIINAATLFLLIPIIYIGNSIIFPNASALAMTHAQDKANASAVINFINMSIAFITVSCMQVVSQRFVTIMPLILLILGCLLIVWIWRLKILLQETEKSP